MLHITNTHELDYFAHTQRALSTSLSQPRLARFEAQLALDAAIRAKRPDLGFNAQDLLATLERFQ